MAGYIPKKKPKVPLEKCPVTLEQAAAFHAGLSHRLDKIEEHADHIKYLLISVLFTLAFTIFAIFNKCG